MMKKLLRLEAMYEKPAPLSVFLNRVFQYAFAAFLVVLISLGIGMCGYHYFEHLAWLDAFLNAAMILGGMGPVNPIVTKAGKIFAGCYALFSGIIFLAAAGLLFAPLAHRLLHRFHLEPDSN
jgi:hypothetical protein